MPKISCIMSVYNTKKYLDECIESILSQSFTDFEFIISDDGSTDGSKQIIEKYTKKDNRIIFLDNKQNRGIVDNLNDCLIKSTGKYIAIMESDDISLNKRFEKQIKYLNENKKISLIGSRGNIIDEKGKYKYRWETKCLSIDIINNCFSGSPFITPGIMFRKRIIKSIGLFKQGLIWDNNFYLTLILNNYICINLSDILIQKRELSSSIGSRNNIKIILMLFKNRIALVSKYIINNKIKYYILIFKDFLYWMSYLMYRKIIK